MTPGVEYMSLPEKIGSPDKFAQTAKKPNTAANNSIMNSYNSPHKRNMTATKLMSGSSNAMGWFNSAGSSVGPGPRIIKPPTAPDN
jgi:hypothetical protein